MRPQGTRITQAATRQNVLIDEVDLQRRQAHVKDKNLASHIAVFRETDAISQIPVTGELWVAESINSHEMHLVRRRDTEEEHTQKVGNSDGSIASMVEGDVHLRAPSTLHVRAEGFTFASKAHQTDPKPLGVPMRDTALGDGTTVLYPLSRTPIVSSLLIYKNGVYMHITADYTVTGKNVTFTTPPVNTAKLAFHYESNE